MQILYQKKKFERTHISLLKSVKYDLPFLNFKFLNYYFKKVSKHFCLLHLGTMSLFALTLKLRLLKQ